MVTSRMAVVVSAMGFGLATSCGAGSSTAESPLDAGDREASADAGTDAFVVPPDQDPNVFPAKHHPLPLVINEGGAVLWNMQIATVTFAGDAQRDFIRTFSDSIATGAFWNLVATSPYAVAPGTSLGGFELADTLSGKTLSDEQDLQPYIQKQVRAGLLPKPTKDILYVFYIPATTTVINRDGLSTCQGIGGYHDSTTLTFPGDPPIEAAYAVIARCSTRNEDLTLAASHEIVEAATEPHPSSGPAFYMIGNLAWTGPGGGEVADVCAGRAPVLSGGYNVARSWANDAAKASKDPCQPAPPGALYFQTAIDTEQAPVKDSWGSYSSDGFVNVARGAAKSVTGSVFSEAALPNDVALVVGAPTSSSDPNIVGAITSGVTATLSRASGHNGQTVVLTIAADAAAKVGDYFFVVRSILGPTEFHSWPVVLRVH